MYKHNPQSIIKNRALATASALIMRPPPDFAFGDSHFFPRGVDAEEDEEEDGEAPERRATVAEEG